jgi:hypothetical protein
MSLRIIGLIGLIAGFSGGAQAITCYEILDAGDATLYRATIPPFPLAGPEWSAGQARLRQQRRHLLWFDTTACPENYSSPAYASVKPSEDATDLLPARRGFSAISSGGIYTREAANPPTAVGAAGRAGQLPAVVVPSGGGAMAPTGGRLGYTR